MGGHAHSSDAHAHGSKSPLAEAYDNAEAKFLGESHHHGKREEWEMPAYLALGGTAVIAFASTYRPSTNPHDWARDEAEERLRR